MMKTDRIAVLVSFLLIGVVIPLGAATQPKFRSAGSADSGVGRYLVTLSVEADVEDLAATKGELAALYGARLDPDAPAGIRQFAVTATAARARLLSSDPRVSQVVDAPATQPAPSAPTPARHFAPQTTGYGDNGQSGTYTYDSSGNITAIGTDTYLYDTENRLTTSVTRGVTETYTYDAFGNRKTATGATNCLGQTTCAQPVAVDAPTNRLQMINGNTVQYDAAGSITDIAGTPSTHYVYDGTAMMTRATVGSDDRQFIYTAADERIAVKQGASWTWTVRDLSQKVLREFTSAETGGANFAMTSRVWLKDYVWRDGLLLATATPNGTLNYHLDHLGTPRLVTDINRIKVAEHAYYPFGAEINLTPHESPEEAMRFTGHERDIVAGDGHTLDDMHARFYSASVGRFLSVDPSLDLKKTIATPQMWNRYAYVLNNPLPYTDPTGKEADPGELDGLDASAIGRFLGSALHINALREAFSGFGSAPWNEKLMAGGVGLIAAADIGSNFLAPEKATAGVLLGENMTRVTAGAEKLSLSTFRETGATFTETMAKNMNWLSKQVKSGARIFDIGLDAARGGRTGVFFKAEVAFMEKAGYTRQFVKLTEIEGKTYRVYEWVRQ